MKRYQEKDNFNFSAKALQNIIRELSDEEHSMCERGNVLPRKVLGFVFIFCRSSQRY